MVGEEMGGNDGGDCLLGGLGVLSRTSDGFGDGLRYDPTVWPMSIREY